jgi:repressor LexA
VHYCEVKFADTEVFNPYVHKPGQDVEKLLDKSHHEFPENGSLHRVNDGIHSGKRMESDLNEKEIKALRIVRTGLVHKGYSPSVREVARALGFSSPRSAMLVLNSLIKKGWLRRKSDLSLQILRDLREHENRVQTVDVPLVGKVACGTPLLAEENVEAMISVSKSLARSGGKYFLLRAIGDSMNLAGIDDGDIVLVRQQPSADNGQKVVALIDEEATVKEFHRGKDVVLLKPRSRNKAHKPFVLSDNFLIQGVVVATLPKLEE